MGFVEPIRDKKKIEKIKIILKESGTRNLLLFVLGINCGLRISDILNLKNKDVQNTDFIEIKEIKTEKYKRFPITGAFKEILLEFTKDKNPEAWVFRSRIGNKALTRVQAYRIIRCACEKAGLNIKIGTHTLRKTFGYHFYQEKKDIALLQTIFNHSTPAITLRYIGINQDIIDENLKNFYL